MKNGLAGSIFALIGSYVWALVFAYTFRIPIPLAGLYGPFGEFDTYSMEVMAVVLGVLVAWVFYGIAGGFIILSVLGFSTGAAIGQKYLGKRNKNSMIVLSSGLVGGIPVFLLSILDYIIGPW